MAFNDAYGQRWKSIREWEEKFIEGEGRKNIATVLRDVWENWINYGWGSYKDSEKFGQRRTDLFGAYVEGEITDSEVVGEVTNYPMGG